MNAKNILIVGIGNSIRGDDGIGAYICNRFEQAKIKGVRTLVTQQLHTEMLDELLQYDQVIFADATVDGEAVCFEPLQKDAVILSSSHHVNASLLNALSQQLYNKTLSAMLCAVKGTNFEMGEELSATAKKNADNAVSIICTWVSKECI